MHAHLLDILAISKARTGKPGTECIEWNRPAPAYAWRVGRQVQSTLFDVREQLGAITARTLVFHGDKDTLPLEGSETWARLIPNARLIRRAEVGHYLPIERPDLFYPDVHAWLAEQL